MKPRKIIDTTKFLNLCIFVYNWDQRVLKLSKNNNYFLEEKYSPISMSQLALHWEAPEKMQDN